jgi:hypothetical protein
VAGVLLLLPHEGWAQSVAVDESSDPLVPPAQMSDAPTSTTITIGTSQGVVSMNNFYQTGVGAQEQYIIIKQNTNYEINYDTYFSSFYIAIMGQPVATWQPVAEQDFLQTLGVSTTDACKLDVAEGVISSAAGSNSSTSFPLSFCGGASSSSTFTQ